MKGGFKILNSMDVKDNITVNQHYIPRFILKHWVGVNHRIVRFWYKRKLSDDSFQIQKNVWKMGSPSSLCFKRYGYEIAEDASILPNRLECRYSRVENMLSEKFYPNLITNVLPNSEKNHLVLIDDYERVMLKSLVSLLSIRMPLLQDIVRNDSVPKIVSDILRHNLLGSFFSRYPEHVYVDILDKYLSNVVWTELLSPDLFVKRDVVCGNTIRGCFDMLSNMDFFFVKSLDASFIFGDNYVLHVEKDGELVFMPFTPCYGVVFLERGLVPYTWRNRVQIIDKSLEGRLMSLIVAHNISKGYPIYGATKSSIVNWVNLTYERYPFVFGV